MTSLGPQPSWDEGVRTALHGAIDQFFDRMGGANKRAGEKDSLEGSGTPGSATGNELTDMLQRLSELDAATWDRYVISADMLHAKVDPEEGALLAESARACGREWARRMADEEHVSSPDALARHLGVEVSDNPAPVSGKRVLFAQFVPESHIDLMSEPLARYAELRTQMLAEATEEQRPLFEQLLPTKNHVRSLILSHELFHVIEDQNEDTIFTRTARIRLWKFLGLENRSTLRCLGEIGAGAFAQEFVGSTFCPFALDILLSWSYDAELARSLYRDVLACAETAHQ